MKETQRRNTFLLYAEAATPVAAAAAATPGAAEASTRVGKPSTQQQRRGLKGQPKRQAQPAGAAGAAPSCTSASAGGPTAVVVGYIIFTTTGLNAHISKLAVAGEWRRRGIARALVRAAVAAARDERRVASVSLHVDADNEPALGLYLGEGFCSEALLEVGAAAGCCCWVLCWALMGGEGESLLAAWQQGCVVAGWLVWAGVK